MSMLREMREAAKRFDRLSVDPRRRPLTWVRWVDPATTPKTTPEARGNSADVDEKH